MLGTGWPTATARPMTARLVHRPRKQSFCRPWLIVLSLLAGDHVAGLGGIHKEPSPRETGNNWWTTELKKKQIMTDLMTPRRKNTSWLPLDQWYFIQIFCTSIINTESCTKNLQKIFTKKYFTNSSPNQTQDNELISTKECLATDTELNLQDTVHSSSRVGHRRGSNNGGRLQSA